MGGMLGIVHFDGKPVATELLQRMAQSIRHRGADGISFWQHNNIGMAYLHLWTTPEAVNETQPFMDSDQNFVVMFHGRIDNREELYHDLKIRSIYPQTDTDTELFLKTYQLWGDNFAAHLLGDFAGVIWDNHKQQLLCVRDVMGLNPFYYYIDSQRFIWSSEPRPFFEVPDVSLQLNEAMIGEYLTVNIASKTETLYQDVYRLPPAHVMTVTLDGSIKTAPYWTMDFRKTIRYRSDDEYAEHFRELFAEAVRCRMRVYGRIGSHLSGGIDSSSVVGITQHLFRSGKASDDKGFETFSLTFPGNPYADESHYIDDVVQLWHVKSNRFDPLAYPIHNYTEMAAAQHYVPPAPNGTMLVPMEQHASANGFRVLLTGLGGDQWFWGSLHRHLDYLTQFRFRELLRELRIDASLGYYGFQTQYQILRAVLPYLLPSSTRFHLRQLLGKAQVQDWINPHFAQRIDLAQRTQSNQTDLAFSTYAQADTHHIATSGRLIEALEGQERLTAFSQIEYRHPFYDRRVAEFALAIPETQHWYQGITKRMLRNAMRSLLPDTVAQRKTKGEFSLVFPPAYERFGGDTFFKSLLLAEKGWVQAERVQAIYQAVETAAQNKPVRSLPYSWALWNIFMLELWLRDFYKRQHAR
jgi:asparagine synthase (glutamine-hydrolysing)